MASIQGKITYIKLGNDFGVAEIEEEGTGIKEPCVIWWYMDGDSKPATYVRTIQQMQLSLLSEAMLNGLFVVYQWDSATGKTENIKVLRAS